VNTTGTTFDVLRHNQIDLALHSLRSGHGRPLLLLHGLGERSPAREPSWAREWGGPVAALDFTGHGASTLPRGGGYTAEMLLADADRALAHLGEATVVGRGLGAYIALLLCGARADRVHGTVLADGPGLSGGPSVPTSQPVISLAHAETTPDPYALVELGRDLRPPDYATAFTRLAIQTSELEAPIAVVARFRPSWLAAVVVEPGVVEHVTISEALASFTAP
jgi:pimeloyl-ACP methyl ester carboxylesterase